MINNLNATDMDKKAIIWLRVSTNKQELDSQKQDLVKLAKLEGYSEKDLIYIEGLGASAIKQDDLYKEIVDQLYSKLDSEPIADVYIWEISRLARVESVFDEIRDRLIRDKIQLTIYKPDTVKLLNHDLTVNSMTMLALKFSIWMAQMEMETKKERFARGRARNRELGKFNGGCNGTLYGYLVDDKNMIQPCPSEAKVVKTVFELYSTGKYSVRSLAKELESRGIRFRGIKGSDSKISGILTNPAYKGQGTNSGFKLIVSEELWNKCRDIRLGNDLGIRKSKESRNTYLSVKILKCKDCGSNYIASNDKFVCYHHVKKDRFIDNPCNNSDSIKIAVMDQLILEVAKEAEIRLRSKYSIQSLPSLREQLKELNEKLENIDVRVNELESDKKKIITLFRKNLYTEDDVDREQGKLTLKRFNIEAERERYLYERLDLESLIDDIVSGKPVNNDDLEELTKIQQKELVQNQISQAMISKKGKITEITIECKDGYIALYDYYHTRKKKELQIVKKGSQKA